MKVKSAAETVGLGRDHRYLGHFRQDKVLNQGHNDGPKIRDDVMPERRLDLYSDAPRTPSVFTDSGGPAWPEEPVPGRRNTETRIVNPGIPVKGPRMFPPAPRSQKRYGGGGDI